MRTKSTLCHLGSYLIAGCVLIGLARTATAATVTLTDDNSTAVIETELQAGVVDWSVDGANQLQQLWYWYRVGGAGPESSIDTLVLDLAATSDTNFDGDDETLFVRYMDPGGAYMIEVVFQLNGGAPGFGSSNFDELITITNTGSTSIDFNFFEYANFDLAGSPNDDTVEMVGSNTVLQTDGTGSALTETVTAPAGNHNEVKIVPLTLDALNDGSPTLLDDSAGPVGPADVSWAFQWSVPIGPGGSFQISKLKTIEVTAACGNNVIDAGEECDGADTGSCIGACVPAGDPNECTCAPVCGDDMIDAGEECDGTDTGSCIGACVPAGDPNECTCAPVCGDDMIDAGEECDGTDTGSCIGACVPAGDPNECSCAPVCGDNIIDAGEECDGTDTGSCVGACVPAGDPNECSCAPVCGDDIIDAGEECDGTDSGSCASECLPPGDPNECTCTPFCGDGNLDPGEECDDGNNVDGDGCSADCLSESGACCNFNGQCEDDVSEADCVSDPNRVWNRGRQCADVSCEAIPTVSEWSLVIMTLLGCTIGSVIYRRRRVAPA